MKSLERSLTGAALWSEEDRLKASAMGMSGGNNNAFVLPDC